MIETLAGWKITGMISEVRELKSQKNTTWVGYVAKLAYMGGSMEVTIDEELYRSAVVGEYVHAVGHLDNAKGQVRLMCDRMQSVDAKPAKAAS